MEILLLKKSFPNVYCMCINVLSAYVCVCHVCLELLEAGRRRITPGEELHRKLPRECLGLTEGPLEEQLEFLTAEPSLRPPHPAFSILWSHPTLIPSCSCGEHYPAMTCHTPGSLSSLSLWWALSSHVQSQPLVL